jgi:hypothetical protein
MPPRRFPSNAAADNRPTVFFWLFVFQQQNGPSQPPLREHRIRREPGPQQGLDLNLDNRMQGLRLISLTKTINV